MNKTTTTKFRVAKSKPLVDPDLMLDSSNRTKVLKIIRSSPADKKILRAKTKLTVHEVDMALEYLNRMNIVERVSA